MSGIGRSAYLMENPRRCLLLPLLVSVTTALAKPGFSEKYQCDYNISLQGGLKANAALISPT
jgi:hypothetical protein